jgi:hypothetical protein
MSATGCTWPGRLLHTWARPYWWVIWEQVAGLVRPIANSIFAVLMCWCARQVVLWHSMSCHIMQ